MVYEENETFLFSPLIKDGVKIEEIDSAHKLDVEAGVDNDKSGLLEEEKYSTSRVLSNNSQAFEEQAKRADTTYLLEKLKKSLRPLTKMELEENFIEILENRDIRANSKKTKTSQDLKPLTLDELKARQLVLNKQLGVDQEGNATISEFDLMTGNNKETRKIVEGMIEKQEKKLARWALVKKRYEDLLARKEKEYLKQVAIARKKSDALDSNN